MIGCQNKFTHKRKKKLTTATQKKYLSVDKLHLQQTQIVKDTNQCFWSPFSSVELPSKKQIKGFMAASNIC